MDFKEKVKAAMNKKKARMEINLLQVIETGAFQAEEDKL